MHCVISIARYTKTKAVFGFLSMVLFRWFLLRNKNISFYKLLGCGKNGAFDIQPDVQQWAILIVVKNYSGLDIENLYGGFIANWWKRFGCELLHVALQPTEGHGLWDGKECFGKLPKHTDFDGVTAVLTRATIRLTKLKSFWKNVAAAASPLIGAKGFIWSVGVGETPWVKQATFSVWQNKQSMKEYAYGAKQHAAVVGKTRKENWYKEEMFVRFKVIATSGSINKKNPVAPYIH